MSREPFRQATVVLQKDGHPDGGNQCVADQGA